jgi:Tfp pilus assembly protein PilV
MNRRQRLTRRTEGFTLVETLVSMTVLIIAFLLVFNLFHASLRYGSDIEKQVFASVIATKKIEDIRKWSSTRAAGRYNFNSDWSAYSGVTGADHENPEYRVAVEVRDVSLESPSSALETAHAASDRRRLTSSAKKVRVTVSWEARNATKTLSVVSFVKEPIRSLRASNPVVVTPLSVIPATVPRDGVVDFAADAYDTDDLVIDDVKFAWYVDPADGNGSVTPSHDGRTGVFANYVEVPNPSPPPAATRLYTGGACRVKARIVYAGVEQWGTSSPINLAP